VALKLLDDENPRTRAEAAASFAQSQDIRAVSKLIRCLEDNDDDVRKAAIDALMSYGDTIVPYLEVSLIEAPPRAKQGILEVMRLAEIKDFELIPFLGKQLSQAQFLVAVRQLQGERAQVQACEPAPLEVNEEILSLIFYALWVYHADMRLMYQALKSESASIAVELVENSIQQELTPYLIPLIEDIPLAEKIERGRLLFPLIRNDTPERLLTFLADAEDPVTRMLALFVIGDQMPRRSFIPIIEARLDDKFPYVREIAQYALARSMNEVAPMPDIIERINRLKNFSIFEG
jgi:HEAT repeat protein